jgi:two-component system OmpR family response regulator
MRLLLVEDDPAIAHELLKRWQGRRWIVRHASDLSLASSAIRENAYDVVVLDLGLPDGDGLSWLKHTREQLFPFQVVIATARAGLLDRVQGLQLADDYLTKPFAAEELDARIERLVRRANGAMEQVISIGSLTLSIDERSAFICGNRLVLPPREFDVLELLARRSPDVALKRALVELLARAKPDINEAAVELYVSRLRRRLRTLGLKIEAVRGIGYQLLDAGTENWPLDV